MSREAEVRENIEKLKHIVILPGEYQLISEPSIRYIVLSVDETLQQAILKTVKSGHEQVKTLHWCRKRLRKT